MEAHTLFKQLTCGATFSGIPKNKKLDEKPELNNLNGGIKNEPENIQNKFVGKNEKKVIYKTEPNDLSMNLLDNIAVQHSKKKKTKIMTEEKLKMLETERINHIRNKNHINVYGKDIPPPIGTFKELVESFNVPEQIIQNLQTSNYQLPTEIQMQAMPIMLSGQSIMACAPTGSGKTAAFLVPIIRDLKKPKKKGFRAIILCPTRELAKQTQRECLRLVDNIGLRVCTLNKINNAEQRYGVKSNQKFDILVTTPKRICYLIEQEPPLLCLKNVKWLILDEADKLFEEGTNSFREQFDSIFKACTNESIKVGLFSATWTNPVAKWRRKNIKNSLTVTVGQRNAATELVDQELLFVGSEAGKLLAFRQLIADGLNPPVLVFVESKERAQQLFNELRNERIHANVIHSDLTQQERDDVVKLFREGTCWVLICTELIGRGIDFKGINLVVNYDFPPTPIAYIHRIGRAGRAGRKGKAITYFTQNDTLNLKSVAKIIKNSGGTVPEFMLKMKDHSKRARRKIEKNQVKRDDIQRSHTYGVPALKTFKKKLANKKKEFVKKSSNDEVSAGKFVLLKRKQTSVGEVNLKKKKVKK